MHLSFLDANLLPHLDTLKECVLLAQSNEVSTATLRCSARLTCSSKKRKSKRIYLTNRYGANRRLTERPKEVVKLYQQLQILNLQFNDCFEQLGMPTFVVQNILSHAIALYISLKLHDAYPPGMRAAVGFWALFYFWLEGVLYTMIGAVSYNSQSFVKSWTDILGVKSRKTLTSMPKLGVKVSSIYVIHRTTVLFVFLSVINLTVQAMLLQ